MSDMITSMNRTLTTTATILLLTGATACSSSNTDTAGKNATPTKPLTASTAIQQITSAVPSAKTSSTITADNDPDHLLGRPNQYTSKVTFTDSRIKAADVEGTDPGDVERGGEVEVFADPSGAQARAKYIQAVTQSLPMLAEYDYVHGTVLVRVSHYLTPTQAAEYKTAVNGLG